MALIRNTDSHEHADSCTDVDSVERAVRPLQHPPGDVQAALRLAVSDVIDRSQIDVHVHAVTVSLNDDGATLEQYTYMIVRVHL